MRGWRWLCVVFSILNAAIVGACVEEGASQSIDATVPDAMVSDAMVSDATVPGGTPRGLTLYFHPMVDGIPSTCEQAAILAIETDIVDAFGDTIALGPFYCEGVPALNYPVLTGEYDVVVRYHSGLGPDVELPTVHVVLEPEAPVQLDFDLRMGTFTFGWGITKGGSHAWCFQVDATDFSLVPVSSWHPCADLWGRSLPLAPGEYTVTPRLTSDLMSVVAELPPQTVTLAPDGTDLGVFRFDLP